MCRQVLASLLLLVALVVSPATGAAGVGAEASLGLFSSFVWRGFKITDDALQLQPSVTVTHQGFALNLWGDYDADSGELLEVDYTASYARDLAGWSLEAGFIHYDLRHGGLDSDEIYVRLGLDLALDPSVAVYYDISEGDGAFIVAGITHPVPLSGETSLELDASMSYIVDNGYMAVDAEGQEFTDLFNGELSASLSMPLGARLSVDSLVAYTFALSDDASDAISAVSVGNDDSFIYGAVTVSVSF